MLHVSPEGLGEHGQGGDRRVQHRRRRPEPLKVPHHIICMVYGCSGVGRRSWCWALLLAHKTRHSCWHIYDGAILLTQVLSSAETWCFRWNDPVLKLVGSDRSNRVIECGALLVCRARTKVVLLKVVSWIIYYVHIQLYICVMKFMVCIHITLICYPWW